jgi:hypothetical protein
MMVNRDKSMMETCMCWGFECGDGWFTILDQLMSNIQHHIDWTNKNFEKGYKQYKQVPQVTLDQVKEKFGTLRFYYYGGDDYCRGAESMAASMTARTCEDCGNPGKLLTQGWHRTLCETHAKEQGYEWNIEVSEEDED